MNPSGCAHGAAGAEPVGGADLPDLRALKADPRVFAIMLGGVRTPVQTAEELAAMYRLGRQWIRHLVAPRRPQPAKAALSASPAWSDGRMDAAWPCGLRYGRRHRVAAWLTKRPVPHCASVTTRQAWNASSRSRGKTNGLPHCTRRHRDDRMRQLHPARLSHSFKTTTGIQGGNNIEKFSGTQNICKKNKISFKGYNSFVLTKWNHHNSHIMLAK